MTFIEWHFQFEQLGVTSDFEDISLRRTVVVGRILIVILTSLHFMAYYLNNSPVKVLFYLYASLFYMNVIGRASATNAAIITRLMAMAEFIEMKADQEMVVKNRSLIERKAELRIVAKLSEIYQRIADGCDERNRCQGFQLMLGFGMMFFYTLFTSFTAYIDLVRTGKLDNSTITAIAFCLFFNFFVATVILTCSKTNHAVTEKSSVLAEN